MTIPRNIEWQAEKQKSDRHPFTLTHDPLKEALGELVGSVLVENASCGTLMLCMPSSPEGPVASPELILEEISEQKGTTFKLWQTPTLMLEPDLAFEFLLALPNHPPHGVAFGSSLRFWATAAKFSFELIARQCYMPTLQETQCNGEIALRASWQAILASDDAERLYMLSRMMPPICWAFLPPDEKHSSVPQQIVLHFLNQTIDAFIRSHISLGELLPYRQSYPSRTVPLPEQWLQALSSSVPTLTASAQELKHFFTTMHIWLDQIRPGEVNSPFRTCFRLDPPSDDDKEGSDWHISFHLQANDDRSLLVPAEEVWKERSSTLTFLKRKFENPQERLLADLGRASRLVPDLEESLKTVRPKGFELNTKQAYAFLRESTPLLEQSGFGILVPPWWQKSITRLGLKLKMKPMADTQTLPGAGNHYCLRLDHFYWRHNTLSQRI